MIKLKNTTTDEQLKELGFEFLESGIIQLVQQDELVHIHILIDTDKTVELLIRTKDNYKVIIMDYVIILLDNFFKLVEPFDAEEAYINQFK